MIPSLPPYPWRGAPVSLSVPISEHSAELDVFGEPPDMEQPQDPPRPTCCTPFALPQAVNVWSGGHVHSHTSVLRSPW